MTQKYTTAYAFRMALESRMKDHSTKSGIDLQRLRRQVAFDRLLCRLFNAYPKDMLLKGGYSMELRTQTARTTKDIDLILKSGAINDFQKGDQEVLRMLQDAAKADLGDYFTFLVGDPTLDLEAVPYGGSRYPIEAHLNGKLFVRFPIDVVISSLVLDPVESVQSHDWLEFAEITCLLFPTISREQQFAEKLHACTLPRTERENSRVKDMIDLVLLIHAGGMKKDVLKISMQKIFEYRNTHSIPEKLLAPPQSWEIKFNELCRECELKLSLDMALALVQNYFQEIRSA